MSFGSFHPSYFTLRREDDVVVAQFVLSHLSDEENVEQLGHELFTLVDHFECRKLVMNLATVQYMTSSVLGKLITVHRRLHRNEGLLILCHLTGGLREILRASRLLDYFHVTEDVDAALARLREAS